MSTAVLELYNALIEAGVDKEKAERAAQSVIGKEEAKTFATKADLTAAIGGLKSDLERFLFTALVGQAVFVIGLTITLIQVLT